MAATKAGAKKAAPRKKGAAARAEKKKEAPTIEFRGLKLVLPEKIPGTLLFDLADLDSGRDLQGTMGLIKSLIGEAQYQAVRDRIGADGLDLEETETALVGLLEQAFDASGASLGE